MLEPALGADGTVKRPSAKADLSIHLPSARVELTDSEIAG